MFAIDDAYTFKNNILTNVRAGFTRQLFPERRRSQGFDLASLGFSPSLVGLAPADLATFPNVDVRRPIRTLGGWESGDGFFTTDVYNVSGSVMWLVGNHNLKFGTEYRRYVEKFEPLSDRGVARVELQQHLDARSARQLRRRAARAGSRVVPARPADRRHR